MVKPNRILFILPQPFYADRGGSYRTRATVSALVENGFEVDLVCFGSGLRIEIPGCTIFRTLTIPGLSEIPPGASLRKLVYDVLLALRVIPLLLTRRYVALQGVEEGAFLAAVSGVMIDRPFVMDLHSKMLREFDSAGRARGFILLRPMRRLVRFLFKWSSRRAAGFIGTNPPEKLVGERPLLDIRGLSLGEGMPAGVEEIEAVRDGCLLRGATTILYSGGLEAHQGIDLLLRSFAELIRSDGLPERGFATPAVESEPPALQHSYDFAPERLRLVISGTDGSTADPTRGERLLRARRLALHLGIEDQVTFTGFRTGENFSALTAVADVVVTPRLEGDEIPTKLYSFLHAGKPLVATRIPAHQRVVSDETVYLCDPTLGSLSESIAKAISNLPELAEERSRKTVAARLLAEERYGYGAFREQMRSLYSRILTRSSSFGARREGPLSDRFGRGGGSGRSELGTSGRSPALTSQRSIAIEAASLYKACRDQVIRAFAKVRGVVGPLFSVVPLPVIQECLSMQSLL